MTPYTIRQKIAYLKRKGVIEGFKIRFSNNLLGFRRYMILISLTENNNFQKNRLVKDLIDLKKTVRIIESIGRWDLVCDVVLSAKEKPSEWLKNSLIKENFSKIKTCILAIKEVLPINTVVHS